MAHRFTDGGKHLTEVRLLHQTIVVRVQATEDLSGSGVLRLGGRELVLINTFEGGEADVFGCKSWLARCFALTLASSRRIVHPTRQES